MEIPLLVPGGLIPAGDHPATIAELRRSYLVTGEGVGVANWDSTWRGVLVDNLEMFVRKWWQVGVDRIFVNGSFVTSKPQPGDIDAYFECEVSRFAQIIIGL